MPSMIPLNTNLHFNLFDNLEWRFKYFSETNIGKTNLISTNNNVRLISEDGSSSIISEYEAMRKANYLGLDLVIVDDRNEVPTVKIMDYGKHQYDLSKKKKAAQKTQKAAQIKTKEIQMRPVTGDNDIKVKAKKAMKFLKDGYQIKIVVRFRGREINNIETGKETFKKFMDSISDYKFVQEMKISGKEISSIITSLN